MCIRDSNTTMAMLELGPIDALIALVGAVMIPFTISAMSTVVPNARASHVMEQGGEVLVRSMAYVLLVSMYGCVGLGAFYYYTLFLPFIAPGGPASLQWWLHVACSMYGLCKGNWDFVCCVFGSPNQWRWEMNGCPPGLSAPATMSPARVPKWCKRCQCFKPPRAHHCSICRRCTARMDHHCPLTGSCIGWFNHKCFLVFTWDLVVGSIYGLLFTYHPFRACFLEPVVSQMNEDMCAKFGRSGLTWAVGLMCAGFTTLLFSFQLHMCLSSDTTVEFLGSALAPRAVVPRERYDRGAIKNWEEMFGPATLGPVSYTHLTLPTKRIV
eukprot:TRINITY_DN24067_c0_g1_i2.p1 TRINITY_DN24067_c0_g1~~TRINITY_DN24067_c0_g1_i2.p1  ORF type:complete len:325 (-),score=41.56 TRINITY_DN24067_c0_g1_i2:125-1099(-)